MLIADLVVEDVLIIIAVVFAVLLGFGHGISVGKRSGV